MYHKERLKAAMMCKGKGIEDLAAVLSCSEGTAYRKVREGTFTVPEIESMLNAELFTADECPTIFFAPDLAKMQDTED